MAFECVIDNFEICFVLEIPKAVCLGGLGPPNKASCPPKLIMKHYISVVFLSNFRISRNPPIENFLAMVLSPTGKECLSFEVLIN